MSVHLIFEFLTAFVGTIAFALLFQVPKEYYVNCGLVGLPAGFFCLHRLDGKLRKISLSDFFFILSYSLTV